MVQLKFVCITQYGKRLDGKYGITGEIMGLYSTEEIEAMTKSVKPDDVNSALQRIKVTYIVE